MSFFFLKRAAKDKLSGAYINAVLGMLICYLPVYLFTLLTSILTMRELPPPLVLGIATLGEIFIIDIMIVGYLRSLLDLDTKPETATSRYDINLVLSGFTHNYKGTLKTMFLRRLYVFGWSCLTFLPIIIAIGIIAFMSSRPETAELINRVMQLIQSPTRNMAMNIADYIAGNCSYVVYILGGASVISLLLMIPYFRKVYQYEMIPFIIAENSDIASTDAFAKTKEIMRGYRMNYFLLQMSFIGLFIIAGFVTMIIPSNIGMYLIMAILMPYMNMTFVQFYLARTRKRDFNEQVIIPVEEIREEDENED